MDTFTRETRGNKGSEGNKEKQEEYVYNSRPDKLHRVHTQKRVN